MTRSRSSGGQPDRYDPRADRYDEREDQRSDRFSTGYGRRDDPRSGAKGRRETNGGGPPAGGGGPNIQLNVATVAVLAGVLVVGIGIGSAVTSTTQGNQGNIASAQQLDMAVPYP